MPEPIRFSDLEAFGYKKVPGYDDVGFVEFRPDNRFYYVRDTGKCLIAMHAKGGTVDMRTIASLLSGISSLDIDRILNAGQTYTVIPCRVNAIPGMKFIALIGPSLSKYYIWGLPKGRYADTVLQTLWAVPVHPNELCHDERAIELSARVNGLLPYDELDREPFPALAMRYKHVHPRPDRSGGGRKMGIFSWKDVSEHVAILEAGGGFVDIENWERHFVHVTWDRGFVVAWGKMVRTLAVDDMKKWLRAYAFVGIAAAWEAIGVELPPGTSTGPVTVGALDQAIRAVCTSTSGSPTPPTVKELYDALRDGGRLAAVCLKTASICAVDPELSEDARGRILAQLADPKGRGEKGPVPTTSQGVAEVCVRVAVECAAAPSAKKFDDMIRTYQRARYLGAPDPEGLEVFWNVWIDDVIYASAESDAARETLALREALARSFVPEHPNVRLEASGDEDGQFFVEAVDARLPHSDRRRRLRDIARARLAPTGRTMRVVVWAPDGAPLGRARSIHYARDVILRRLCNEFYRDQYDILEVANGENVWTV